MKKISDLLSIRTTVTNRTIFRVLIISSLFFVGVWAIYTARTALTLLGISFFLAIALSRPVNALARRMPKDSRGLATGAAYLVVLGAIGGLLYIVIPPLITQTRQVIENAPNYINELETSNSRTAELARRYNIPETLDNYREQQSHRLTEVSGPVFTTAKRIISSVAALVTILVLTFFMVVEGPAWMERFWALQPKEKRQHRKKLVNDMYKVITGYVNGQLFIATLGAVSAYIALRIIGISYALPLAGIVWFLNLIPLIGATVSGVMLVIITLFHSVPAAIVLGVYLLIYQQLENNFVQPYVQSKAVNISPLLILASALIGANIAGLLGALIAIPVASCIRILVNDFFEDRHITLEHNDRDEYHGKLRSK